MQQYEMERDEEVVRGCGLRHAGGIYLEVPLSDTGALIEDFLFDPPVPLPADLPVSPLGITMIEKDGVWHVVDWVGGEFYPDLATFVEEARRFGISRRIGKLAEFGKLTKESNLILVHAKAVIDNWDRYPQPECPTGKHGPDYRGLCCGIWWEDVEHGERTGRGREVKVTQPSFVYHAEHRPDNVTPDYRPGFFARFRIGNIAVIRDEGGAHHEALEAARASKLPVKLVSE